MYIDVFIKVLVLVMLVMMELVFLFNIEYDFGCSYGLFDSFSVDKYIFRYLYESHE